MLRLSSTWGLCVTASPGWARMNSLLLVARAGKKGPFRGLGASSLRNIRGALCILSNAPWVQRFANVYAIARLPIESWDPASLLDRLRVFLERTWEFQRSSAIDFKEASWQIS